MVIITITRWPEDNLKKKFLMRLEKKNPVLALTAEPLSTEKVGETSTALYRNTLMEGTVVTV